MWLDVFDPPFKSFLMGKFRLHNTMSGVPLITTFELLVRWISINRASESPVPAPNKFLRDDRTETRSSRQRISHLKRGRVQSRYTHIRAQTCYIGQNCNEDADDNNLRRRERRSSESREVADEWAPKTGTTPNA